MPLKSIEGWIFVCQKLQCFFRGAFSILELKDKPIFVVVDVEKQFIQTGLERLISIDVKKIFFVLREEHTQLLSSLDDKNQFVLTFYKLA